MGCGTGAGHSNEAVHGMAVAGYEHVGALPPSRYAQVEVEASLRRRGGGLQLAVHQLNGVLRLQQD